MILYLYGRVWPSQYSTVSLQHQPHAHWQLHVYTEYKYAGLPGPALPSLAPGGDCEFPDAIITVINKILLLTYNNNTSTTSAVINLLDTEYRIWWGAELTRWQLQASISYPRRDQWSSALTAHPTIWDTVVDVLRFDTDSVRPGSSAHGDELNALLLAVTVDRSATRGTVQL